MTSRHRKLEREAASAAIREAANGASKHIESAKFAQSIRCKRIPNNRILTDRGDGLIRCDIARVKPWRASQVLLTTPEFTFVLPKPLTSGDPMELLTAAKTSRAFAIVPQFEAELQENGKVGRVQVESWAEPISYADLDRAVNVCQEIGRWDMAVHLLLDLLGGPTFEPQSIQWAGFPHTSRMAFVFSSKEGGGWRGYIPSGAPKQVLEYWWGASGGYHARRIWLPPRSEYDAFMASVRNPWKCIGVDPALVGRKLEPSLLPVMHVRAAGAWDSRYAALHEGVGYRGDENGTIRPYYYVTDAPDTAPSPEKVAWGKDFRDRLVRHMNLPVFIAREVGS